MNDLTAIRGCEEEVCTKTQKPDAPQGTEPLERSRRHDCLLRSSRQRTVFILMAGALLMLLVSQVLSARMSHSYYINLSPSVPLGFYKVIPHGKLLKGDLVIFDPPQGAHTYIYGRRWLPCGWPLIKYVGAGEGDTYAIQDRSLTINDKYMGPVYQRDSDGKVLPNRGGRFIVERDTFLPVSTHIENSFDGRYFGTVPLSATKGKLKPVWTF
jgi:conjugative transfer signal peptidase TraF